MLDIQLENYFSFSIFKYKIEKLTWISLFVLAAFLVFIYK